MAKAGRVALAVVAGAAVWATLWLAGSKLVQSVFPEIAAPNQPITHAGVLWLYIVYGAVCLSLLAGYTTAALARHGTSLAVGILAALQLSLGIIAELSYWELAPLWYHLIFLALIMPLTWYGGLLRSRGRSGATALARA